MRSQLLYADWDVPTNVVAFTTTRGGGVSGAPYASFNVGTHVGDVRRQVDANRAMLQKSFPADLRWQWLEQVHGSDVLVISAVESVLTGDALLTREKNLICCVQTADCLPVFVAALDGTEVAMIHAGWKGLASGIVENTIAGMASTASELSVWLGPAIGPCHFEVGAEVKEFFLTAAHSDAEQFALEDCFISSQASDKLMANLYAIARLKLSRLGISRVAGGGDCTHCDVDRFFSYRRDGVTGRMLNAIYIEG